MLGSEKRPSAARVDRGSAGGAAWLTALGNRPQQQDVALMAAPLFGIFDGHGPDGLLTAQRAADLLRQHFLVASADASLSSTQRIERAFERTQSALLQENIENGTTATLAFHFPETLASDGRSTADEAAGDEEAVGAGQGQLVLANVGDSRAVLCHKGAVVMSSADHDLTQAEERKRCEAHGGRVVEANGCMRVVPPEGEPSLLVVKGARRLTLNMSRALGHRILTTYGVSAQPQLYELSVRRGDRLVIASDGLWDVLTNDTVAFILSYQTSPVEAVTALYNEAMDTYHVTATAADNISLLVVFF